MSLAENIATVQQRIAAAALAAGRDSAAVTLVAATKTQSAETIRAAIAAGVTICGENRVQEFTANFERNAYAGANIHFIGHLQTNKVKFIVGKVDLIESITSPHLLEAVANQAEKLGLVQDILLEVNIGGEESKGGCPVSELPELAGLAMENAHVRLRGLMAIPPIAESEGANRAVFAQMAQLSVDIRREIGDNQLYIDTLSMGMSRDYEDAVRAGATLVRVGTALFGTRESPQA